MAVLVRAAVAWLALGVAACYSPELRDCATTCTADNDCAPGQACGSDRLCAGPELAGRCGSLTPPGDGEPDPRGPDARVPDAQPMIDSGPPPVVVSLRVRITGRGRITIDGVGTCVDGQGNGDCTYSVEAGVPRTARAIADPGREFDKWQSAVCDGQGAVCAFTPSGAVTELKAKFGND